MNATTGSRRAVVTTPGETQIVITREFDAPARLVYRAYTTPELVKRWWAGERGETTSAEIDLRVGGTWRYVMTVDGGFEVAFHGEFSEIVPNERLVSTEVYEGRSDGGEGAHEDGGSTLNTTTFTEKDGRTILETVVECHTREVRDAILASGMEGGMQESMTALEAVARSLDDAS